MELENFIRQVSDSLADLPEAPLNAETDFKGLKAWDSLAILTVTDTIDCEYDVLLKKDDYQSCVTLRELYDLVLSKSAKRQ